MISPEKTGALFAAQDALMPGVTSKKESIEFLFIDMHRLIAADECPYPRLYNPYLLPTDIADVDLTFLCHMNLLKV